jgi:ATP-dependent protease Clp ATPase subunit
VAAVPERRCRFCQKAESKVSKLVAGPEDLTICDECIALLCDIVAEEDAKWRKRQIKRLLKRDSLPDFR